MGSDLASIMPAIHVHQPSTTCYELQHPKVIDEYLKEETRLGHVIGPFNAGGEGPRNRKCHPQTHKTMNLTSHQCHH